ncbi:hypothetical protein E1287_38425 [Actinomadura sp. KC06]|uniref:hypothetical protein n=1 Tax=Actinomadura sp. KC06 TaxID=2530369 RepID=UPI00104CFECA|nr:hypothetical protein [Actinomadura sp. KC06]TDD24093.1 hypothetical protein E1287_38425 [Actinomadura sp. KC06]
MAGLSLIAIDDAAIPVTVVTCDVLAQERKPLPLLDEYLLRLVAAGVDEVEEIARTLGLEKFIVEVAAADRISDGSVNYSRIGQTGRLLLTDYGRTLVTDLSAVQPVQRQLKVSFDRMTWQVADYPRSALAKKRDVARRGLIVLPALQSAGVKQEDIVPRQLNRLLGEGKPVEILSVRKVRPSSYSYLPVKLLVYADPSRGEVRLGVVVEDAISREHGMSLERSGGASHLNIEALEPETRPGLADYLEQIRVPQEQVDHARKRMEIDLSKSLKWHDLDKQVRDYKVRSVNSFEQPYLVTEAIDSALRRLLIFSPTVRFLNRE